MDGRRKRIILNAELLNDHRALTNFIEGLLQQGGFFELVFERKHVEKVDRVFDFLFLFHRPASFDANYVFSDAPEESSAQGDRREVA